MLARSANLKFFHQSEIPLFSTLKHLFQHSAAKCDCSLIVEYVTKQLPHFSFANFYATWRLCRYTKIVLCYKFLWAMILYIEQYLQFNDIPI